MYDMSIWLRNRYDVHEFSESVTGSEPTSLQSSSDSRIALPDLLEIRESYPENDF